MRGKWIPCVALAALALLAAASARASQLVTRDATNVSLAINTKGEALVTARVAGRTQHVLAWGAVDARVPKRGSTQVSFRLDYSGGYGKYHDAAYWQTFAGQCATYDGPALAWMVAACKAADGSYWALQSWQRMLPDYGLPPTRAQSAWELRLSHWTAPLPTLAVSVDWSYHRYDQLFGTYTYAGQGVYGFSSTSAGDPLDSFGRNVYLDTFDSAYGKGWKRDNSFLTHRSRGSFCYGLYPHGVHPSGAGTRYRVTAEGPGVMPDVMWTGDSPGRYDAAADRSANRELASLKDPRCRPN